MSVLFLAIAMVVVEIRGKVCAMEIHLYWKLTGGQVLGSHSTHNPPVSNLLSFIHQILNEIF